MGFNEPALVEMQSIVLQCLNILKDHEGYSTQEEFESALLPLALRMKELAG